MSFIIMSSNARELVKKYHFNVGFTSDAVKKEGGVLVNKYSVDIYPIYNLLEHSFAINMKWYLETNKELSKKIGNNGR